MNGLKIKGSFALSVLVKNFLFILKGLLLFVFISGSASAESLYLNYGQSINIKTKGPIETVFVSNPAVADYKIVNKNTLVLYAKNMGDSELVVYGKNSTVLQNMKISVDPFLGDLNKKMSKNFHGSTVEITRFVGDAKGESATYVITGTVTDEESMDAIYQLVGNTVAKGKVETRTLKANDDGGETDLPFMTTKTFANVINRMQLLKTNQINVQLTVVEVSKSFTDALGIDWSSLTLDSIINGGAKINSAGTFSLIGFKRGFDAKNISTTINAIKNDSVAKVMAQPNLTVLSGERASFLVGGEIPILTKNKDGDGSTLTYKEYGIKLNIAAKVEKKNKIKLYLSNEISSVAGSYSYSDYNIPTLVTRRSSSTIELGDGDSFVIGGLLSQSDKEVLGKIPFIGDIPILGALARNSSTQREKSELVIFATVNLVKPVSTSKNIDLPVYRKTSSERLFFNVGVDGKSQESRLTRDADNFVERSGFAK